MTQSTDNTEKLLIELSSKIDNLGKDIKQELINIDKRLDWSPEKREAAEYNLDRLRKRAEIST